MEVQVTTYHLEMTDRGALQAVGIPSDQLELKQVQYPCPEFNRFFYTAIGGDWYWADRLGWTYEQWRQWADRPELETWVAYLDGAPAGYFELERQPGGNVEIAHFGLLPSFTGRGLGGWLLTAAIERAWQSGASRVWVHTCSLDHPRALANYQSRGLRLYKTETEQKVLPDHAPGPWPGARTPAGQAGLATRQLHIGPS
jgi:GNAT superfamily N-acetyltransferase